VFEDPMSRVGSIENMENHAAGSDSWGARHERDRSPPPSPLSTKKGDKSKYVGNRANFAQIGLIPFFSSTSRKLDLSPFFLSGIRRRG
jgi:hypothetical protein